jgi:hypothetical protein
MSQTENNNKKAKGKHVMSEKRRAFPRKPFYIIAILLMGLVAIAFLGMLILADLLPSDLTIMLSVASVVLLLLTCFLFASRRRWKIGRI